MESKTKKIVASCLCIACIGAASTGAYFGLAESKKTAKPTQTSQAAKENRPVSPFEPSDSETRTPFEKPADKRLATSFQTDATDPIMTWQEGQDQGALQSEKEAALRHLDHLVKKEREVLTGNKPTAGRTIASAGNLANDTEVRPILNPVPKPDPAPIPVPDPTPTPRPEPTLDPVPIPDPTPTPAPTPSYEASLTMPKAITIHALSSFAIQDYASASDENGKDISAAITLDKQVDTSLLGEQEVIVSVHHHDAVARQRLTVKVINDAPVIQGEVPETIWIGEPFDVLAGIHASDTEEGDLTKQIQVTSDGRLDEVGDYTITYTVQDSFGAEAKKQVTVQVKAKAPTFEGIQDTEISVGDTFDARAGIEVHDAYGKIDFEVTGEVDTTKPGKYVLLYQATNDYGMKVEQTRTITVTE